MSKRKMNQAHKDVTSHLECLVNKYSDTIGISNILYLIFFETFRCLFDVAPTKKDAMELMKDAMSNSKDFLAKPKKKKPTNATLH
jgi:hypothetical protein